MDKKLQNLFLAWKEEYAASEKELTKLDAVGGDGDLGIVLMDGFTSVYEDVLKLEQEDLGKALYYVGKRFNNAASSSLGTLLSAGFMNAGKMLKGKTEMQQEEYVILLEGITQGIATLGKANEGEKTILDALYPAARAARANVNKSISDMMDAVVVSCEKGVDYATGLEAKHGRLAFRQKDSMGIVDPGCVAALHFVKAMQRAVKEGE